MVQIFFFHLFEFLRNLLFEQQSFSPPNKTRRRQHRRWFVVVLSTPHADFGSLNGSQFHKEQLLQAEIARMKTELAEKEVRLQERDSEMWLRWLEAQEKVARLERQLAERVVYTVLVYTGNKKGASSSAQARPTERACLCVCAHREDGL